MRLVKGGSGLVLGVCAFLLLFGGSLARAEVTYSQEISRIFQTKCQQCHRPNDIAPFALTGYQDAATWAEDIGRAVSENRMPPWKPVAGHGEFQNNYSLTAEQRQQILDWVAAGAPEGNPADLPEPAPDPGDWVLGEPDLVVQMAEEYTPPRGRDMYRCFVIPTESEQNQWVSTVDIVPGNRKTVHHVILFLDTSGVAEKLDAQEEGPGYTCFGGPRTPSSGGAGLGALLGAGIGLGGWAPGTRPRHLPDGVGLLLPAKGRIVMQVHYYTNGGQAADQTRVGIYLSKKPVERRLWWIPIVPLDSRGNINLVIPAGAERHESKAVFPVPPLLDARLINVFPHMHLLGREIKAELDVPREETRSLIYIDNWDFNWQGAYTFVEPIAIPAFSNLRLTCIHDNSANNPRNPNDPLKTVRWGEGTEDEMCLVFLGVTFDRENLLPFSVRR